MRGMGSGVAFVLAANLLHPRPKAIGVDFSTVELGWKSVPVTGCLSERQSDKKNPVFCFGVFGLVGSRFPSGWSLQIGPFNPPSDFKPLSPALLYVAKRQPRHRYARNVKKTAIDPEDCTTP